MRQLPVSRGVLLGVLLGSVALLITVGASLPQLAHPSPWCAEQAFTTAGAQLPPITRDGYSTTTSTARQSTPPAVTSAPLPAEPAPSVQPAHRPVVRRTAPPSPTPTPTATPSPTVTPSPSPSPILHRLLTSLPLPL